MFIFAIYAASYGVTYAYMMHYFVNALCLWFFVIHLSSGPVSLANLVQYITGADGSSSSTTSKGKKRP